MTTALSSILISISLTGSLIQKKYDKRDDFSFPIVIYPFLDGDVPLSPSYGVYISQLVRFTRVCNNVLDFSERNLSIILKNYYTRFFDITNQSKHLLNFIIGIRTSFVNITQHADILYVQVFHIQFFMVIFLTKHKNVSSHLKSLQNL